MWPAFAGHVSWENARRGACENKGALQKSEDPMTRAADWSEMNDRNIRSRHKFNLLSSTMSEPGSKKQKTEEPIAPTEPYVPKNILLTGGAGERWKSVNV